MQNRPPISTKADVIEAIDYNLEARKNWASDNPCLEPSSAILAASTVRLLEVIKEYLENA